MGGVDVAGLWEGDALSVDRIRSDQFCDGGLRVERRGSTGSGRRELWYGGGGGTARKGRDVA